NTNSTGSNTAAFISSSTRADSPSMDFLKSTGLGYRYTFLTLAPGRIMRKTSRGNTGGQHGADRTLVVGGVYGALTVDPHGHVVLGYDVLRRNIQRNHPQIYPYHLLDA